MDSASITQLRALVQGQRTAALGTLRNGFPLVSMVLFAPANDFSAFLIHISRLAHHTRDILEDPRVGLMIADNEATAKDPQTLARVSITGKAAEISRGSAAYHDASVTYLGRFPNNRMMFGLADFMLYQIVPEKVRYVAGFGKIFNLGADRLVGYLTATDQQNG